MRISPSTTNSGWISMRSRCSSTVKTYRRQLVQLKFVQLQWLFAVQVLRCISAECAKRTWCKWLYRTGGFKCMFTFAARSPISHLFPTSQATGYIHPSWQDISSIILKNIVTPIILSSENATNQQRNWWCFRHPQNCNGSTAVSILLTSLLVQPSPHLNGIPWSGALFRCYIVASTIIHQLFLW